MLVFDDRGKPEYPGKNLSWQSREPTNSIHMTLGAEIEHRPDSWTLPSNVPVICLEFYWMTLG